MADEANEEEEVRRVLDTVDSLEAVQDPAEQARRAAKLLAEWPQQHARIREIRQRAVIAMRAEGMSYRQIGEAIGVHFTRVKQIELGERGRKEKPDEQ